MNMFTYMGWGLIWDEYNPTTHTTNKVTERRTADGTADGERSKARASRSDEDAEQDEAEQEVDAGGMRGSHDSPAPLHCFAPADSTREVSTGRIGRAREVRVRSRAPHA